ncbi:helix-turn-helix domain-containing protein [Nocardioides sp. 31GB23]|uniref:helix-turn-helix domain-containing protein n=1 Tax=Nocardioides sp. 31GB23 TaxID=3156065 RepID=UPI0032AF9EF3
MAGTPDRRKRAAPSEERRVALTERIQETSARYDAAAKALQDAEKEFARSLLDAYLEGMTWAQVAAAAGLATVGQARARAESAMTAEQLSPSRRRSAALQREGSTQGVSVAEAARRLGRSRSTIYQMLDDGRLVQVLDPLGRARVLLDDE